MRPARDLVDLLDLSMGARILDVGSGTGVVAAALAHAIGASGRVVAVDPSAAMLSASRLQPSYHRVVARMPGLPFPDASFDAVAAGFVISHLASHVDGLTEMVRVCKSGGRAGVTAWGTQPNPAGTLWKEVATTIEGGERLTEVFRGTVPWGAWLSRPANLEYALREARLIHVTVVARDFVVSVAVADCLAMKGATVEGTLLWRMLTAERWDRFTHAVMEAFRTRFGDVVEFTRDFLIGLGTKP